MLGEKRSGGQSGGKGIFIWEYRQTRRHCWLSEHAGPWTGQPSMRIRQGKIESVIVDRLDRVVSRMAFLVCQGV